MCGIKSDYTSCSRCQCWHYWQGQASNTCVESNLTTHPGAGASTDTSDRDKFQTHVWNQIWLHILEQVPVLTLVTGTSFKHMCGIKSDYTPWSRCQYWHQLTLQPLNLAWHYELAGNSVNLCGSLGHLDTLKTHRKTIVQIIILDKHNQTIENTQIQFWSRLSIIMLWYIVQKYNVNKLPRGSTVYKMAVLVGELLSVTNP